MPPKAVGSIYNGVLHVHVYLLFICKCYLCEKKPTQNRMPHDGTFTVSLHVKDSMLINLS